MSRIAFRRNVVLAAITVVACAAGHHATAQDGVPNKPVRIIVPYAPGGVADAQARILAQRLQARWGQTVTVENRAGGNTVVGTAIAAKAPADCSTLFLGTLATVLNDLFYDKLPYNRATELAEVSLTTKVPNVLVVGADSRFKTLAQLVAYGKANPGKLTYASTGQGGSSHLSAELLATLSGIKMVHVPFSGGAAAQRELIPGRVDFMFDSSAYPAVLGGKVRALAVGTTTRSKLLPDVPTLAEAGFRQFNSATWFGFYVPRANGQVPACVKRVSHDIAEETKATEVRARFFTHGAEAVGSTPEEMVKWEEEEQRRWSAVIKQANITIGK